MNRGTLPDAANFIYSKEFRSLEQMDRLVGKPPVIKRRGVQAGVQQGSADRSEVERF